MSDWQTRDSIPDDGTVVEVQSVRGLDSDNGEVWFDGKAAYIDFSVSKLWDELRNEWFGENKTQKRWVDIDSGYCVPGRIVRWRPIN